MSVCHKIVFSSASWSITMKAFLVFFLFCLSYCRAANDDLDKLSLRELLDTVKENDELVSPAVEVFRQKYSEIPIFIQGPFFEDLRGFIFEFNNYQIQLRNYNAVLDLLTIFGGLIKDLSIVYTSLTQEQSENVTQAVNKYCSKSLLALQLVHCKRDAFNHFQSSFENVSTIYVSGSVSSLDSEGLKFNEIFPKLRHVTLNHIRVSDLSSLERHFIHLEHVDIHVLLESDGKFTFEYTDRILKNNSQIRSFTAWHANPKILEMVNKNVPNLEVIEIYWNLKKFQQTNDIRFENLKKLRIIAVRDSKFPENILFPRLESLLVSSVASDNSNYSAFIGQQTTLQKLQYEEAVGDEGLQNMIGKLPHLTQAVISVTENVQPETVSQFLLSCDELTKLDLTFSSEKFNAITFQQITGLLDGLWTIKIQDKYVSFIRN